MYSNIGVITTPSYIFCYDKDVLIPVNDTITSTVVRTAIKKLYMYLLGVYLDLIGVHSLCIGRDIALKLHGELDTTIMKVGHWSGLIFLQYIHNQSVHHLKKISQKMGTLILFINIASIMA